MVCIRISIAEDTQFRFDPQNRGNVPRSGIGIEGSQAYNQEVADFPFPGTGKSGPRNRKYTIDCRAAGNSFTPNVLLEWANNFESSKVLAGR